jgi:ribosomal protein S18 acetylase RimI-like enzyme
MGRFSSFLIGLGFTFSVFAADPGCSGRIREVLPLGGAERVATVEAINEARSALLTRYTGDLSVQELLSLEGRFGFVAIRDERVVGFVVYEKRAHYIQIVSVGVAETAQRQGVGRDLIENVIDSARQMREIEDVRVLLRMEDQTAQAFFTASEFAQAELIAGRFDAQTQSGRLMKRSLGGNVGQAQMLREPQLQLAPQAQTRRARVAVAVLPASLEFLHRIDPTLQNAR